MNAMRFHFTIRDLLWLTVVVALAVGWWVDQRMLRTQLTADQNTIRSLRIALQDEMTMHDPSTYNQLADEIVELRQQLKSKAAQTSGKAPQ
jgi:hypothetical protein